MKWLGNRKYRIRAALAAGMLSVMVMQRGTGESLERVRTVQEEMGTMWTTPLESVQVCGWWGTMYPKFCFAKGRAEEEGAAVYREAENESVADSGNGRAQRKVKISFWLAKAFDW